MKTENIFVDYLKSQQKEKLKQVLLKNMIILKKFKPSEKTKKQLNLPDNFEYMITYNPKTKELTCDCPSFVYRRYCHHTKYFEAVIKQLEKQNDNTN